MRRSPLLDSVTQSDATDHTPAGNSGELVDASATIDHRELYRLPWSLPDNAIAWLEPTKKCNLACFGCYRVNDPRGTSRSIRFAATSTCSSACAPSTASRSPAATRCCTRRSSRSSPRSHAAGLKPIVNTNGIALTPQLARELKAAGIAGFTFHVDSKQGRPHWKQADEIELCELRQQLAEIVAAAGGIGCSFNATVYEDTLRHVPDIVEWAHRNIEIVNTIVFIAFRAGMLGDRFDYLVRGVPVDFSAVPVLATTTRLRTSCSRPTSRPRSASASRTSLPPPTSTEPSDPTRSSGFSTDVSGTKGRIYGYVGPRSMELAQSVHHLATGRYLAYTRPQTLSHGRAMLALSPLDPSLRTIARRWLAAGGRRPSRLLERLHFQSVMIIQPADIYEDGRQNMCDGCPDMTVWNDRLVWSCRLEEPERFGDFVQMVPKSG